MSERNGVSPNRRATLHTGGCTLTVRRPSAYLKGRLALAVGAELMGNTEWAASAVIALAVTVIDGNAVHEPCTADDVEAVTSHFSHGHRETHQDF